MSIVLAILKVIGTVLYVILRAAWYIVTLPVRIVIWIFKGIVNETGKK